MNDPLHDHIPHMVPHTPNWPVGRYELTLIIGFTIIALCAIGIWMFP
jgi:hypothetical protein